MKFTAVNLVQAISKLPRGQHFDYFTPATKTLVRIESITKPEGPIHIKRYDPSKGQSPKTAKEESISPIMLSRVANAIRPGVPINIDRILGASYNTRSALETLLGLTPQFSFCYPGRIEVSTSTTKIRPGHKHLVWLPDSPHALGKHNLVELNLTISEIPSLEAVYEAMVLPEAEEKKPIHTELDRIHAQMQVALVEIAAGMDCRSYVAKNDQGIKVKNVALAEFKSVVTELADERLISNYPDAAKAGSLIDCIWFKNAKYMPAVLEVEYSTGVTSGLIRMLNFQDNFIPLETKFIIAAPDEDRSKVLKELVKAQFQKMKPAFLPFTAIHELYAWAQRGRLRGVSPDIMENFVERPSF